MRALFVAIALVSLAGCRACGEFSEGFKEGWAEGKCEESSRTAAACRDCCANASGARGDFASGKCKCVSAP